MDELKATISTTQKIKSKKKTAKEANNAKETGDVSILSDNIERGKSAFINIILISRES